jgi:diguanylate cyclase (GGDEF)-like protein/PAS domain S-box-containing protein
MNNKENGTDADIRLKAILDTAVDAIICINSQGIIDIFNHAAEKIFGYSSAEMIGKNVNLLMPEPDAGKHDEYLAKYERTAVKKIIGIGREVLAKRKNGEIFPIELAVSETEIAGRRVYTGIIRDITLRKQSEEKIEQYQLHLEELVAAKTRELEQANIKLQEMVNIDSLTNLANRRYFDEVLDTELRRAIRTNTSLSLLMCDIDYYKLYNDYYGHVQGDECLRKIAECFKAVFMRATDTAARFGGEEFAVILPNTSLDEARQSAMNLSEAVNRLNIPHKGSLISDHITISAGITCMQSGERLLDTELVQMADEALYTAKDKGRNRIEVYEKRES